MNTAHEHRKLTDDSLAVERDRADAAVALQADAVATEADTALRAAREAADLRIQKGRDRSDRDTPRSKKRDAKVARAREREDEELEHSRETADAVAEAAEMERKRYMEDFLALERDRTDEDLVGERALADTLIASRDEFLATVSHDLRTLLGGLSFSTDLLLKSAPDGADGAPIRKYASSSMRHVVRMNRLVNDLLDIASIEAGKLSVIRRSVSVARLLSDTVVAFEPVAVAKQITLTSGACDSSWTTVVDAGRILQVLANLVSNAIKFTPAGGVVTLAVTCDPAVRFTVKDSGIGIASGDLEKVFDRFRQVSKDRRGLGIGLHISKCIVEAHGGRMWAESELAVGSSFHFELPA